LIPAHSSSPDGFEGRFRGKDKSIAKKKATTARLARLPRVAGLVPAAQAAE
jgi:methylenetetrahydrofolate--tRNA-(uracil-5-)-methyltransferase